MRIQRLLFCLLLAFAPAAGAGDGWLTSVDEALAAAEDGDRYVLVDLYAEWCGWCKVLEREVFTSPEFGEFTGDMVLLRVDVDDGGEGSALQARYEANSLPTTLILDSQMVKIGEVKGYAPTREFIAMARRELEEFESMLELYERVERGDDLELKRRLAEDFHDRGDGARAAALYQSMLEQTKPGTAQAWLLYMSADSYRLSGQFSRAESSLERARDMIGSRANDARQDGVEPALRERIDLLGFHIAHDSGDCRAAMASLEHFLENHPHSGFRSQARRTLAAIRRGDEMKCS